MSSMPSDHHRRILVIDDNQAIHEDFRKVLGPASGEDAALQAAEERLFGARQKVWFDVDTASQGEEGLHMVERALAEGRPYSMAFVDVRMPPGWDGIETVGRIWKVCPDLQVVICTAFSDCSWSEMQEQINPMDRLLILKKPFDTIEVLQLANSLTEKWRLLQESRHTIGNLDHAVKLQTQEIIASQVAALEMRDDALRSRQQVEEAYEELKREVRGRRKLEEQFREQASLLDKARDAIFVRNLDHSITFWNKGAERLFGWTAEEALGRSAPDLICADLAAYAQALAEVMDSGEWVGELQKTRKDGREVIVESRWTLVCDSNDRPTGVLSINTDITDQKRLEQQFLRAQRMESIGTLAGGIAHDLNNILTPITMAVEVLRMKLTDKKSEETLATIASSAQRGAEMVSQVLSFARGVEGRRVEVQVRHLITDIIKMCRDTFPKDIQTMNTTATDPWTVEGDPTQLHQVLLNLCVNARDAMPQGGKITISAANITLDETHTALELDAKLGPHVLIQVTDTGSGMPQDVIGRIFDPFFTTKELGKGTGLGLSTSLTIVKSHGGFIRVESQPGKGTRFSVYLPAQPDLQSKRRSIELPPVPRGRGETVLIVDDEQFVRQITQDTLESYDYHVLQAADGMEAISVYGQHQHDCKIAAVLMDMMMPRLDGPATIKALMKINPDICIIGTSGINDYAATARALGASGFVPKPYTADTLLTVLKEALDARS
jgi:two-component system, cell cycle sensor histidine kinase and response regulator CckA